MSLQTWVETLVPQPGAITAAGTLFNTYTTAKTVLPVGCLYTLPANYLIPGKMLRMTVIGAESHRVTGPDTMTFQFMLGSNIAFTSGAIPCTTTAHTTIPFWAECIITVVAGGTSANVKGQWRIMAQGFALTGVVDTTTNTLNTLLMPNTAPAVGANFDATATQTIDFWVAQSFSGAGNGIQVHQYSVEALN